MNNVRIQPTADLDEGVTIGDGSSVWHLAQVRHGAELGRNVIVGRGAYIGEGVHVGDNCKIQNYALVYEPAVLEDGVFIGPAVVLTNDHFPRAVNPDGSAKSAADWEPVGVTLKEGCSVGARATCVAPVTIGRWATVAAGSVVVKDVPDFALVAGVPARRIKWVGRSGFPLVEHGTDADGNKKFLDEKTGDVFVEADEILTLVAEGEGPNSSTAEGSAAANTEENK
ncbi:acyltransferase [Luteococcus sp.]|uniref:acyltransferase n=1 Tax=Luteococcus sp. TaxID=1969402 RepID=UPI0037364747